MPSLIVGVDHVQLAAPAGCEAKARQFFGELLGMKEIEKPEKLQARGGVWFECGPQQLHIGVESDFQPAKKAHPGFSVGNLDALRRLLEDANYPVKEDPLPGVQRIHTEDPFGNRLEFIQQ